MDFFRKLETKGIYFNEEQKKAIIHIDGPLLVAAGPGSGKTSVITARTAYLIKEGGIDPSNILVITFTRAAANEMKSRFKDFPGITAEHLRKVDFGTFHSTFYKIINSYYGRNMAVLQQSKAYSAIKYILRNLNEPLDDEIVQNTLNEISMTRMSEQSPEYFKSQYFSNSKFRNICSKYEDYKHSTKCIDFDDMVIMCKNILESNENVLSYYRQRYRYFLVDEFQDTNKMQFDTIKLLCHPLNNLCVVGDEDQSIYGFRGSMHDCFVSFKQCFKQYSEVVLSINYRSTHEIIELSKKIISHNTCRIDKDLKSSRGTGEPPVTVTPPDEESEARFIAETVETLKKNGYQYRDFAVLYRSNIQSRHIIDELIKRDMPFNIKDSLNNFYDHWICRDLTCYLKLSLNSDDCYSLAQIINKPVRYISRDIIDDILSDPIYEKKDIEKYFYENELKEFQKQKVKDLFRDLRSIRIMTPSSAVNYIRKSIGYDQYIRSYCMDSNIEFEDIYDILDEYEASASGFSSLIQFLSHIHEVSQKLKDNKKIKTGMRDSMTLSTIHGAKGLEFSCVFVIGVVEGLYPHKKSTATGENIEEERRLLYVGVTRARNKLFICSPKRYLGKACETSRFIKEISEHPESETISHHFNVSELVSHSIFGVGRVVGISKGLIEIQFNRFGRKKLDLNTCIENKLIEK